MSLLLFLGIMSKDAMQTLTAKKQPRPTIAVQSRTAEKVSKPLTIAEMRADIQGTDNLSTICNAMLRHYNTVIVKYISILISLPKIISHNIHTQSE